MEKQDIFSQLQFDLDDLLWSARLSHSPLEQTYAEFNRLTEKYVDNASSDEQAKVQQLLAEFQSQLDSGAVTAFVENVA